MVAQLAACGPRCCYDAFDGFYNLESHLHPGSFTFPEDSAAEAKPRAYRVVKSFEIGHGGVRINTCKELGSGDPDLRLSDIFRNCSVRDDGKSTRSRFFVGGAAKMEFARLHPLA